MAQEAMRPFDIEIQRKEQIQFGTRARHGIPRYQRSAQ